MCHGSDIAHLLHNTMALILMLVEPFGSWHRLGIVLDSPTHFPRRGCSVSQSTTLLPASLRLVRSHWATLASTSPASPVHVIRNRHAVDAYTYSSGVADIFLEQDHQQVANEQWSAEM